VTFDSAWAEETAEVLKALGEPTRLSMVRALYGAEAPVCICDFTAAFELSQPTISHHMAKLKAAGQERNTGLDGFDRPVSLLSSPDGDD
jgi:predicted transcriptional regulator